MPAYPTTLEVKRALRYMRHFNRDSVVSLYAQVPLNRFPLPTL